MSEFVFNRHEYYFKPMNINALERPSDRLDLFGTMGSRLMHFFDQMSDRNFLWLTILFQVLFTFQGLDLSDEGFSIYFYHVIFSDPMSASYNFMFWLTGVIGGTWMKLFGWMGLWGARLGGVLINTATLWLSYSLLKDRIRPVYLKLGLLCVLVNLNNDIKIINYNTLSALVLVGTISLLVNALTKEKNRLLVYAGMLIAASTFIRIPNVLQLGVAGVIIYHNWREGLPFGKTIRQLSLVTLGFLAGVLACLLCIQVLGHWEAFRDGMDFLFRLFNAKPASDAEKEYYSSTSILTLFVSHLLKSVAYAVGVLGLLLAYKVGDQFSRKLGKSWLLAFRFLYYGSFLALLVVIAMDAAKYGTMNRINTLFFLNGLPLLVLLPMLVYGKDQKLQLIFLASVLSMIIFPLGSSNGIITAGRFNIWLAFPIALAYLLDIRSITLQTEIRSTEQPARSQFLLGSEIWTGTKALLLLFTLGTGLIYTYFYPGYDWNNRAKMFGRLESRHFGMILTTPEKAAILDDLFAHVRKYSPEQGYVLAYSRMPMLYYATDTRSFLHNPFPYVYSAKNLQADIDRSLQRHGKPPVLVQQLIHTSGQGHRWPTKIVEDYYTKMENVESDKVIQEFIQKHQYTEVWNNQYFRILVAPETPKP